MEKCNKTERFVMDKAQIDSIFRILNVMAKYEKQEFKKETKSKCIYWLYIIFVIIPFVLAGILAFWRKIFGWEVNTVGLVLLGISYLGILILPFVQIWLNRGYLLQALRHPLLAFISNAKITTKIDNQYLHYLMQKPKEQLRIVFLELSSEKEAVEKRIKILIGAIDKVGLFPGILSFFVLITPIDIVGSSQPNWLYAIAYATPIIYFIGSCYHFELSRLSRLCNLIENALKLKEENRNS